MLTVHSLSKSYNLQTLFKNVTFSLNPGDRVGLIGPNGCGKTTLLRILTGEEQPDDGNVSRSPALRIAYLPQGFEPDPEQTIEQVIGEISGDANTLDASLVSAALAISEDPDNPGLQAQYDDLLRRIEFSQSGRASEILAGLGLSEIPGDFPVRLLSGGQKTRLSLALVLLNDPQLLLLDEPTNHLDIAMLEWLENWLSGFPGAALIVSHDRTFLDHTVGRVLEMDLQSQQVREYEGNYSAFLEKRQVEIEKQWSAYHDQQDEIRRMGQDIARVRSQAEQTERKASSIRIGGPDYKIKGYKSYQQGIAKKVAKKAKARQSKLKRYLDSEERVERPRQSWVMNLEFEDTPSLGKTVIQLIDLAVGYDHQLPLLEDVNLEMRAGRRIILTGPNGSGKTTLLRTIVGQIPPLAGKVRLGASVHLGYLTQDQSGLDPALNAVETVAASFPTETEARSFLHRFLFSGDEPLKPVNLLSYGQRTRLMLAKLVVEGCNVLLLDEPVNHLDIPSRTQFEDALRQFEGAVLAVVHDRFFINRFAEEIWWTENGKIKRW
jgi:ATP-binding cassette, subfamily F, member 3